MVLSPPKPWERAGGQSAIAPARPSMSAAASSGGDASTAAPVASAATNSGNTGGDSTGQTRRCSQIWIVCSSPIHCIAGINRAGVGTSSYGAGYGGSTLNSTYGGGYGAGRYGTGSLCHDPNGRVRPLLLLAHSAGGYGGMSSYGGMGGMYDRILLSLRSLRANCGVAAANRWRSPLCRGQSQSAPLRGHQTPFGLNPSLLCASH
jgi:hypothetical protein